MAPFTTTAYDFDSVAEDFSLKQGAYLYRVGSLSHCHANDMLSGGGSLASGTNGRFNVAHQRTTYCANNVFTCLAEVMFHMYRTTLAAIMKGDPIVHLRKVARRKCCLHIAQVDSMQRLVNIDSREFSRSYAPKITGTMTVHPDWFYDEFQKISTKLREGDFRGIAYPSARHSRDFCFALFKDETGTILPGSHDILTLKLQLVHEDQDFGVAPNPCEPNDFKLSPTVAHYEFEDPVALAATRSAGRLNPDFLPNRGYVDFVRRRYQNYLDAVRP